MAEAARSEGRRFFGGDDPEARPAEPVPYSQPRAMSGSAEVINLKSRRGLERQQTQRWQTAAWDYYDKIGELKYAFNLISQIVSRTMLYAAVIEDTSEVPVDASSMLKKIEATSDEVGKNTAEAIRVADEAVRNLTEHSMSEMLRLFSLNLSVPGECYLIKDGRKWIVASIDELIPGTPYMLRTSRSGTGSEALGRRLPEDTYVARIWRSHPRWSAEADSSMLGVLDQAEKVVLFDQVMRTLSRSRLSAGALYIPTGITAAGDKPLDEALNEAAVQPIEDESVAQTVTPLLLVGPPEIGEKIKRIELGRDIDENMMAMSENAIDRMLAGLDIPKNIVSGLADTRYSNALIIDDSLYKAHIEPLILMICDSLTTAYLRPVLARHGIDPAFISKFVIWYNPSQIVTRPDRSSAANEGYDRFLISGDAWRRSRGYSDLDAPTDDEIVRRLALEKVQIPQDTGTALIENLHPSFFERVRRQNQSAAGVPPELGDILSGSTPTEDATNENPEPAQAPLDESAGTTSEASGGDITPGGTMPPRNDNRGL